MEHQRRRPGREPSTKNRPQSGAAQTRILLASGPLSEAWGRRPNPPAITVAFVSGFAVPGALVEIDAIAAIPE
jgi:hypothetical protein